jgi:hypothetical protein
MDNSRRSYVEDRSQKEDTGVEHCQNIETDRRSYPPKGIQSRTVPRFASLRAVQLAQESEAPPLCGALILSASIHLDLVGSVRDLLSQRVPARALSFGGTLIL